jgi:hypothetical protein
LGGHIKAFIEEEGLKIFYSFQLCGVLQAKVLKKKILHLISVRKYSNENMPYFWQMQIAQRQGKDRSKKENSRICWCKATVKNKERQKDER